MLYKINTHTHTMWFQFCLDNVNGSLEKLNDEIAKKPSMLKIEFTFTDRIIDADNYSERDDLIAIYESAKVYFNTQLGGVNTEEARIMAFRESTYPYYQRVYARNTRNMKFFGRDVGQIRIPLSWFTDESLSVKRTELMKMARPSAYDPVAFFVHPLFNKQATPITEDDFANVTSLIKNPTNTADLQGVRILMRISVPILGQVFPDPTVHDINKSRPTSNTSKYDEMDYSLHSSPFGDNISSTSIGEIHQFTTYPGQSSLSHKENPASILKTVKDFTHSNIAANEKKLNTAYNNLNIVLSSLMDIVIKMPNDKKKIIHVISQLYTLIDEIDDLYNDGALSKLTNSKQEAIQALQNGIKKFDILTKWLNKIPTSITDTDVISALGDLEKRFMKLVEDMDDRIKKLRDIHLDILVAAHGDTPQKGTEHQTDTLVNIVKGAFPVSGTGNTKQTGSSSPSLSDKNTLSTNPNPDDIPPPPYRDHYPQQPGKTAAVGKLQSSELEMIEKIRTAKQTPFDDGDLFMNRAKSQAEHLRPGLETLSNELHKMSADLHNMVHGGQSVSSVTPQEEEDTLSVTPVSPYTSSEFINIRPQQGEENNEAYQKRQIIDQISNHFDNIKKDVDIIIEQMTNEKEDAARQWLINEKKAMIQEEIKCLYDLSESAAEYGNEFTTDILARYTTIVRDMANNLRDVQTRNKVVTKLATTIENMLTNITSHIAPKKQDAQQSSLLNVVLEAAPHRSKKKTE